MDRPKRIEINRGLSAEPHRHDPERGWYWRVVYWEAGQRKRFGLGWFQTRREAMVAAAAWVPPVPEEEPEPEQVPLRTLRDLLSVWLPIREAEAELGRIRPRTIEGLRFVVPDLAAAIGDIPLAELRGAGEKYHRARANRLAPTTIRIRQRILTACLNWAVDQELIAPQLSRGHTTADCTPKPSYTPTTEEIGLVLGWVRENCSPWVALALTLQATLGTRVAELGSLNWPRIDSVRGVFIVNGKTGRREIPVPLDAEIWGVLREWRRKHPVSLWPVGPHTFSPSFRKALGMAQRELGLPLWGTHALRRAMIERLLEAGADPGVAASLTGHSPAVMLEIYYKPRQKVKAQVMGAALVNFEGADRPQETAPRIRKA